MEKIFILIKNVYNKASTANIVLNSENHKVFLLMAGRRRRYPLPPLTFNNVLELLANSIKQEMKIKGTQNWKKEIKLFL